MKKDKELEKMKNQFKELEKKIKEREIALTYRFDSEGFDIDGFNSEGFDRRGYDAEGYNKKGFNERGFNRGGVNSLGYSESFCNAR